MELRVLGQVLWTDDVNAGDPLVVEPLLHLVGCVGFAEVVAEDREVANALFEILENQKITEGKASLTLLPARGDLLAQLVASGPPPAEPAPPRMPILETR